MLTDRAFVPILNRSDWRGRSACAHRPLLDVGDSLVVAYGLVTPESNQYLTREAARTTGKDITAIEAIALANLAKRPGRAAWKRETIEGATFLARSGDELTAADLLSAAGMRKAHEFFKAERLFVAVPTRMTMIASADPLALGAIAVGIYDEAVADNQGALSSDVLLLENGVPVGIARREGRTDAKPDDTSHIEPLLVVAPFLITTVIAGDVGEKQGAALRAALAREAAAPRSPFVGTVVGILLADPDAAVAALADQQPMQMVLALAGMLHRDLSDADRGAYLAFLREVGDAVARAGGGLLGFGGAAKRQREAVDSVFRVLENPAMATLMGALSGDDDDQDE